MNFDVKLSDLNQLTELKTIVAANEKFKTICFNFSAGGGLPNHSHNGFATIQVLDGEIEMLFQNGSDFELSIGQFLSFDARVEHNVVAKTDCKVLISISESLS